MAVTQALLLWGRGDVTVMAAVLLSCNYVYYYDVAMVQVLLL